MQKLMAHFFLFRLFVTFLTSLDDTSMKKFFWNDFFFFFDFRNAFMILIKRNNFRERE